MVKRFNTTGICYPEEHYMVDITSRLDETAKLVDRGEYFVINRARQYGKTTTLHLLADRLKEHYSVLSISFEGMSDEVYRMEQLFVQRICGLLYNTLIGCNIVDIPEAFCKRFREISLSHTEDAEANLFTLSNLISQMCLEASRPVVLIIDEVDQAASQQVFPAFLGMLRDKYLNRKTYLTFQSVILAGVYDIKNLKLKVRPDSSHQYNSPWNIASDFTVDMSFSVSDIAGMLHAYEHDYGTGMDVLQMAENIYNYTSGYPFLVSRLCRIMDEILLGRRDFQEKKEIWTQTGFLAAVKELLAESNTLFDDMVKKWRTIRN